MKAVGTIIAILPLALRLIDRIISLAERLEAAVSPDDVEKGFEEAGVVEERLKERIQEAMDGIRESAKTSQHSESGLPIGGEDFEGSKAQQRLALRRDGTPRRDLHHSLGKIGD